MILTVLKKLGIKFISIKLQLPADLNAVGFFQIKGGTKLYKVKVLYLRYFLKGQLNSFFDLSIKTISTLFCYQLCTTMKTCLKKTVSNLIIYNKEAIMD